MDAAKLVLIILAAAYARADSYMKAHRLNNAAQQQQLHSNYFETPFYETETFRPILEPTNLAKHTLDHKGAFYMKSLGALVGKPPADQLRGFRALLAEEPIKKFDYTPIVEHVDDIVDTRSPTPHYPPDSGYAFGYEVSDVHTGSHFGHEEISAGDDSARVMGSYHVLLPDGRLQRVRYEAGPHGYHADVTYH